MPKLHFLSACTGFVIAGFLALTTSQASPPPATLNPAAIRIEYVPHPRDMVQIKEGTPYTVPAGKLLVITAIGDATGYFNTPTFNVQLSVNGQVEAAAYYPASISPSPTVLELAQGLVAKAATWSRFLCGQASPAWTVAHGATSQTSDSPVCGYHVAPRNEEAGPT